MKLLVTGGAGYIGSHIVLSLGEMGHDITVVDNLSTGRADSVLHGRLMVSDLSDTPEINALFQKEKFDAVMHFAASIDVNESTVSPMKYYKNNFVTSLCLLELCLRYGVNKFIFSSTAAVYGEPDRNPIDETALTQPINPYGMSKLMVENALHDIAKTSALRFVALRYFNVAGADPLLRIGQKNDKATHIIATALRTAMGFQDAFDIFGSDYDTPDGTCIRDYIHIMDIVNAHLLSLNYLSSGNKSQTFNCGYGHGYSVREVIEAVKRVTGTNFLVRQSQRRAGDSPVVVADSSKIRSELGWAPSFNDLDCIIKSAWDWETLRRKTN